jgi:class 3 adenylate cyclase
MLLHELQARTLVRNWHSSSVALDQQRETAHPLSGVTRDCLGPQESRPDVALVLASLEKLNTEAALDPINWASNDSNLLSQMLPKHAYLALRQGREVVPRDYSCVTIFFCDIVTFTSIASLLSPAQVSRLLHDLWTKIDALLIKYSIFKIETAGDALLAVTNMTSEQPDHALRMAKFAIEVVRAASTVYAVPGGKPIQIRVGICSGSVTGSVLSKVNPRYSITGDAVNFAARLETSSLPNKIHVSVQCAQLIRTQDAEFGLRVLRKRPGQQDLKGIGRLETYFVEETDV